MITPLVGEDSVGDPRRAHGLKGQVLQPRSNYVNDQRLLLSHMTAYSHLALACGSEHTITTESPYTYKTQCSENAAKVLYNVDAEPGVPITICKYMAYHKSKTQPPAELCERVEWSLDRALEHGFESLLASQREYLDKFWQRSDIQFIVDPEKARRPTKEMLHLLFAHMGYFNGLRSINPHGRSTLILSMKQRPFITRTRRYQPQNTIAGQGQPLAVG